MICRADTIGRVPDRVPGPDGHPAPACGPAPSTTWWSRSPSSAPAPSRAGRCIPTSAAATARSRSPTCIRCSRTALAKTLGVPLFQEQLMQMAIDVAGFSPARGRPAAPGDGVQAQPGTHGAAAGPVLRGNGRAGDHRATSPTRSGTSWPPSPTTASPRATRCRSPTWSTPRLDQAPLSGGVLRGAAQRPTDGLLLAPHPGAGRPPPRGRGSHPRPQRVGGGGHPRTLPGFDRWGGGPARGRVGALGRRRAGRADRRGSALPGRRGPEAAGAGPPERVGVAGDRRGVRGVLRPRPSLRRCGRRGRWPRPGPTGWPGWSPVSRHRPCPGCPSGSWRWPTCGPPGCRPTAIRRGSCASSSTSWGW